ncbi:MULTISPECIES: AAA family ATPase [Bacillus cereus group]|uniref:AAA family ATPase n=1 Tax=Bacillus cereus group TaxID=86661 RepID=UPI000B437626|nr:AAA family ATPase [Bacillus thuringiensis]ARZ63017.1 hypothetical protein B7P25_14860 [Bacillus thuringiensis]
MEFCYYWIDEYNDFMKGQGFNFGGEYIFKYDPKKQKLTIEKNEKYIKNFFNLKESGNISNITAIVGRNGVGKSTIIDAMKGLLIDGGVLGQRDEGEKEGYYFYKRILVIKEETKYKIIFHEDLLGLNMLGENNIEYVGLDQKEIDFNFSVISYGTTKNTYPYKTSNFIRVDGTEILQDTICIYFSNVFDSNPYFYYSMPEKKYFDISIKGLLNSMDKPGHQINNSKIKKGNAYHLEQIDFRFGASILKDFSTGELEAKILALQDRKNKNEISKYMSLPEKLLLNLDYILYKSERSTILEVDTENLLRCELEESKLNKIEKMIYSKLRELASDDSEESLAKRTFYYRIIDAYFTDVDEFIHFKNRQEKIKKKLEEISEKNIIDLNIIGLLNIFKETVVTMNENEELDSKKNFNKINKFIKEEFLRLHNGYIDLINYLETNIQHKRISFQKGKINSQKMHGKGVRSSYILDVALIEITLDDIGLQLAYDFIGIYRKLYTNVDFIKFSWEGISSGEDALYSILSRFHLLRENVVGKNAVIFFDEGELYLHPEWQRKYIDIITSYLQRTFILAKNIHIVFATNSPLLISDLPNHNVIFLDRFMGKSLSEKCKVVDNSEFPQTFAANIHNLMVNGFFMESTMGEFSVKKINRIIELLKGDVHNSLEFMEKSEEIDATIKLIGEPIVRKKLNRMFEEKRERVWEYFELDSFGDINQLKKFRSIIDEKISNLENKDK